MGEVVDLRRYIDMYWYSTETLCVVLYYVRYDRDLRAKVLVELHYRRLAGNDVPDPPDAPTGEPP